MGAVENFFTSVLPGRRARAVEETAGYEEPPPPPEPAAPNWGIAPEYLGSAYNANDIYFGERARDLDYRGAFFYGRIHDKKAYDMNGAILSAPPKGFPGAQGFLAQQSDNRWIPIAQRRPNAPYRIARTIVKAFTGMLLGQQRWPAIRSDDEKTQAWCEAVVKVANIRNRFTRGRNMAGACGTVGFSWAFRNGKPLVRVHSGRFCTVLEWEDPDEGVPRHVTELYRSFATRQTEDGPERYEVWVRRDWTPEADIVFKPVEALPNNPDVWVIDEERSHPHGDGECHFVWVTNVPDDEDPAAVDGQPDYAELYEQMETLDGSNSVLVRGVTLNLDPTLVVRTEDPREVKVVKKGSDNAIVVSQQGDAKYLTLESGVVDSGEKLVTMQRRQILEVAQCVVADPNEVAAAGTSSLTMKLVYAPMIGATELIREPFGAGLVRLLEQMHRSCKRLMTGGGIEPPAPAVDPAAIDDADSQVFEHEDLAPNEQEPEQGPVVYYLDLPRRIVTEDVLDENGTPTGEKRTIEVEQEPGNGKIDLEWGEYFPPTADDKQKTLQTMSTSAGGKSVLSQHTAVEITAGILNKDATQEWERVSEEAKRQRFEMPGPGGEVAAETELPDGETPLEPPAPDDVPEPAPPPRAPEPTEPLTVQEAAMNGAQVSSLLEVVMKVATDEVPLPSAIEILVVAFNMDRETARRILSPVDEQNGPPVAPREA